MHNRFLKKIAMVGAIAFTLFGSTPAKAMWESLGEDERRTIRQDHLKSLSDEQRFNYCGSNHYREPCPIPCLKRFLNLHQGSHTCFSLLDSSQGRSRIDLEIKSCPGCKSSITTASYQATILQRLDTLIATNTQLQQQHANTLLEMEGLKDDVQRLKAEPVLEFFVNEIVPPHMGKTQMKLCPHIWERPERPSL